MNPWSRSAHTYSPFWLPLTVLTQGGPRPSGCWGMKLGQTFPPRAPWLPAHSTERWVQKAWHYSREAGEGLPGRPAPGTERRAIMLSTQPSQKVHGATFSSHPTNLSKLNYNYGSSRKLDGSPKTGHGLPRASCPLQPSGQAGNFFRVNQIIANSVISDARVPGPPPTYPIKMAPGVNSTPLL